MGQVRITRLELGPDDGYWFAFAAADKTLFDWVLQHVKALSVYDREWTPEERAWWISATGADDLAAVLDGFAEALTAVRKQTGQGSAPGGQESQAKPPGADGERKTGKMPAVPQDVGAAFTALHLLPSAPPEVVKAVYRALSKSCHPDHGGSHREMVALNRAVEIAETWATTQAKAQTSQKSQAGARRKGVKV